MKMEEAFSVINKNREYTGYMVSFERKKGSLLFSDHFPDKHAGEKLIKTEKEAWALARAFAEKTIGECVNIYVINDNFAPVENYKANYIKNR